MNKERETKNLPPDPEAAGKDPCNLTDKISSREIKGIARVVGVITGLLKPSDLTVQELPKPVPESQETVPGTISGTKVNLYPLSLHYRQTQWAPTPEIKLPTPDGEKAWPVKLNYKELAPVAAAWAKGPLEKEVVIEEVKILALDDVGHPIGTIKFEGREPVVTEIGSPEYELEYPCAWEVFSPNKMDLPLYQRDATPTNTQDHAPIAAKKTWEDFVKKSTAGRLLRALGGAPEKEEIDFNNLPLGAQRSILNSLANYISPEAIESGGVRINQIYQYLDPDLQHCYLIEVVGQPGIKTEPNINVTDYDNPVRARAFETDPRLLCMSGGGLLPTSEKAARGVSRIIQETMARLFEAANFDGPEIAANLEYFLDVVEATVGTGRIGNNRSAFEKIISYGANPKFLAIFLEIMLESLGDIAPAYLENYLKAKLKLTLESKGWRERLGLVI